jgi:hypothetical protein
VVFERSFLDEPIVDDPAIMLVRAGDMNRRYRSNVVSSCFPCEDRAFHQRAK